MIQLTKQEFARYQRHLILPEIGIAGQEKIKSSTVLVVGAGGLGCSLLQYLCSSGIGKLGVMDNDWIDESNLPRQILYRQEDIGKPKPLVAKEFLNRLNPDCIVVPIFDKLNKTNVLNLFADYDIIVDCTDNFPTRYLINDAAVLTDKPVVYGAASEMEGQVSVFNYNSGPTLRCLYPSIPNKVEAPSCEFTGIMSTIPGIIGSIQATEVLKIVIGREDVLSGKILYLNARDFSIESICFQKDPVLSSVTSLGDYNDSCELSDNLIKNVSLTEIKSNAIKDALIVDLRQIRGFELEGISHICIPYHEVLKIENAIESAASVVFYCDNGILSSNMIAYLSNLYPSKKFYQLTNDLKTD